MTELPLFPLDTVLFPGTPIQLHIFEPRYRQMIRRCLEQDQAFGVVLIQSGSEALGPLATPFEIGCSARIERVDPLEGGDMRLLAIGHERFRILRLLHDEDYLVGEVAPLSMIEEESVAVTRAAERLRPWILRYCELLASVDAHAPRLDRLPADPLSLAWTAAWLLQVPGKRKQAFLASERPSQLLDDLLALYRKELPLAEALLMTEGAPMAGPFSVN